MFLKSIMAISMLSIITYAAKGEPVVKYSPVGTWEYSVPGVPEGYDTGIMVITENEDGLVVEVGSSREYLMKAEKVEFDNTKLSFVVYVEYEEIRISGEFDKEKFAGKVSYVEGEFDMTATKLSES